MSDTWIILGATSAMARAFARSLAAEGAGLLLAGRDGAELALLAQDCRLRGARLAEAMAFDTRDAATFAALIARAAAEPGPISAAVFAGSMPPQAAIDADPALIEGVVADNFAGPARFLQMLAPVIEARGAGTVVGVGSVAGDRGRLGNYVYGAAKAGFHAYLSGLRNRLGRAGGHVVTVKPGFVDTAMTWGLPGMFLVARPEAVAADIRSAILRRRNVIYTPFFWRWIMLIIRTIPEPIFKKLKI
ncbi:short-chain dehydrogenase [Rhodobacter veldkampii DSM 11550]|uniref:Short-chain dehydrogenase n=1 Tax=Phaeovulum veldkampii DSM 11550 TaxID=1185920 RepID=A0A2T4JMW8_9RHOB|nr:SDR family oxidoreductase [Phaeovulum veldkampii]MBK5945365.1 short-chain dehydrogenase [Phaeovulum veldkampii DSM 11550]PTE19107.1 short-chain dehydrogenase [Phaeovulum veldkampii DSM 11550]TDQ61336.1 short-subunit dehydrogenase [Phaeovulum veldkampii DSM 11550]